MKTQIGWYILPENTEKTIANWECAAWWEKVEVKAGRYPIYVYDMKIRSDGSIDNYDAYIDCDATTICDYFGSMYCGVPLGHYDTSKNAGKPSTYPMRPYLYDVSEFVLKRDPRWELLPEYEARPYTFEYDGEEVTVNKIYKIA